MKHFLPATQSYSPPKCFRLNKRERKNGPPTILVTIPMGSSAGETIVLDIISAPSKMLPPKKILPKITLRLSGPKISLHRWGTTNPTNPIKPVKATQVPTIIQTKTMINVFFDKDRMHDFFYKKDILYSDIKNTEVILFPLFQKGEQYFIYNKNYFYDNWNKEKVDNLIQYTLPGESIENIEKINLNRNNIYELEISDFFKEYENNNIVFINIQINKLAAEIFLSSRIEGKKIKKNLSVKNLSNLNKKKFYDQIIVEINNIIVDLIKSQNLIDVRTPSFLNVELKLNKKNNLIEFNNRLSKIDLIDNFYIQQLNKDYVLIKIKYLGKINKIINKLKDQNIKLKMISGQWQLKII